MQCQWKISALLWTCQGHSIQTFYYILSKTNKHKIDIACFCLHIHQTVTLLVLLSENL